MNHIYRLVFNRALGVVQVVSELASASPGGRNDTAALGLRRTALALACAGLLGMASVLATMPASAADIVIPATDTPGDLSEDTAGPGNISQSGPITVGGTASLVAGGTIALINAGNDFSGAVSLVGGTTAIRDANALTLGTLDTGALTAISTGALNLGSGSIGGDLAAISNGGAITQSGALTVAGNSTLDAGTGAITVANAGNDFTGTVSLSGDGTQIRDANALTLGTLDTGALTAISTGALNLGSGSIGGGLTAISNGGAITQSGALTVAGNSTLDAGTGAITVASAGNDFTGTVSLSGGGTQIRDANALTLGTLDTGALTAISTGALNLGSGSIGGGLAATSNGGTITQSGALTVAGSSTFDAGSGDIALSNAGNDFQGAVSASGTNIAITDINDLSIASLTNGPNGNVSLIAGGALALPASDIATGTGNLTLAANGGALSANGGLSGGNVSLTGRDGVMLSSDVSATGALALASTNAAITQLAGSIASGGPSTITAGAGTIALNGAGNDFSGAVSLVGGATAIRDANALTLGTLDTGALTAISTGALNLGSGSIGGGLAATSNGGTITQSGALAVAGSSTFDAGSGDIALSNAGNDFQDAVGATGGSIALTDSDALAIASVTGAGPVALSAGGSLTLGGDITTPGTLALTSGGAIAQSGGAITAGMLQGDAAGSVNLSGAGNNIANLGDFGATDFSLTNSQALTVTGTLAATGNVVLNDAFGIIVTGMIDAGTTTFGAGTTLRIGNGGTTGSISGNVVADGTLAFDRSDDVALAGAIAGGGALVQQGSGTLTLDGDSSAFAGSTDVRSGGLIVGGSAGNGAALGGDVDVGSGALLGGHGTIGGNVAIAGGAHLAPGTSLGTLTIDGNLSLAQGSQLDFEFGAPGADFQAFGAGDGIAVGGDLSLDGAVLNVADAGGMGPGLYNLFGWGGTLNQSNGGLVFGALPAGDFQLQILTGDKQINLIDSTGMTLNFWNGNGLASATQLGGGDGTWSTTSMTWTDATGSVTASMQPQPGFAIFGGDAGTVTIDNGSGNVAATGLQFASDGYVLDGDALTLVADGGTTPAIRVGDGSAAGAGMTATIGNVIAGSDGLVKTDLGTLVLTGANTYSGGTTVNGGTLEVAGNAALGSGSVTVDNAADQGATLKVDSGITLANAIALNNGGTLDNAGTLSHTGPSEIGVIANGGMATITNHDGGRIAGDSIGLWLITGGTVVNSGSASRIDGAGYALVTDGSPDSVVTNENGASIHGVTYDSVLMIQGGTLINQSGASISGDSVAVRMSQSGTITNQGGASIRGTGASSYGVILHQGGTITNQGGASIEGGDSGIALAGASTIVNSAGSSIIGGNSSVSVSGSGAVSLVNAGALVGDVALDAGALNAVTLLSGSTLQGGLYIGSNTASTLALEGGGTQLYSDAVSGTTTFSGALTKDGNGTWVLDRDLATAGVTIADGTLQIGAGGTTGAISGDVANDATLAFDRSDDIAFSGAISGSGTLVQSGSGRLTLAGDSTLTGGTTISGGTLRVGAGGTTGSISGDVVNDATLAFDRSDDVVFSGVISGGGDLLQQGAGTLVLDGDSSGFSGSTGVQSGGLIVGSAAGNGAALGGSVVVDSGAMLGGHGTIGGDVSIASGARVAPGGSIGALTIVGNAWFAQGSELDFEFGAPGAGFTGFGSGDSIAVGGNLTLDGAVLNITDAGGMGPGLYNLFSYGGTLSESNGGLSIGSAPGGSFQLQNLTGSRQINLIDSSGMTLQFWNGNGLASSAQLGGGDGTWSTTSMNWTDASGSVIAAMQPQPGFAIFGGAAGTVKIDDGSGAVSATGMQFASDGYVLNGDTLTLVADGGATPIIRVGDGSSTGAGFTATIGNVIAGSDGLIKTDLGTLVLSGANTYSGGTTVNGGVLSVASDGNLGDASGGLTLDGGTLQVTGTTFTGTTRDIGLGAGGGGFDIADAGNLFTVAQALDGGGALIKDGLGTLVLGGENSYSGGTTIDAGTLQVGAGGTTGSIVGDVVDNGTLAFDRSDAVAFAGAISGSGALVQQGGGTLTLDGDSGAFAGSTDVRSGSVIVGSVAGNAAALGGDVAVASGAALGGHGSIGGDVVNAGTLAPGASIGTFTIHGDYTQTATGTLAIEADASGQADLLVVDGVATLDGSTLVLAQSGNWMPRTDYTILTAGGGVSGEFDSATSSLLFLDPVLGYGANAVTLSLQRNDTAFEGAARTRNQRATAVAADGLDWGNAAYVALTKLDADSAPPAFDALSGEVHASARTALLDDSRYLREAINRHLQATGNGAAGAWTAAWGHWARSDSDGNADAMRGDALGFAIGADIDIAEQVRVGAVIGSGQLTTRADARASVVDIDSRHLGLYGSLQAGGLLLQGGAAHSRQQAGSKRLIAFGGYADLAQADYDARTTQVYLDGSRVFAFGRGSLAPFLNLAQVRVRSEAFDETGGYAALHVGAASSERTYATVGARWTAAFGSQDAVQWQGSVGWMHAFGGDDVPLNDARFLTGSDTFTIAGTPIADNAFALDAGLRWQADPQVVIDAGYVGRFASDVRDQGARVTLNWAF